MSKLHAETIVSKDHSLMKKDRELCVDMADFRTKMWIVQGACEPLMMLGIKDRLGCGGHVSDGHESPLKVSPTGQIWDDCPSEKI